ncbi:MAG: hypothetical protein IJO27_01945, partial [Bacilli bacterium]|nr:hypothetical protein [Bacilli bacterium]
MDSILKGISLEQMIKEKISLLYGLNANEANVEQIYKATAIVVNELLRARRKAYNTKVRDQKQKRVYYLSMEFL